MGLKFDSLYDNEEMVYVERDAVIKDANGNIIFEQKNVMAPEHWSQTAVNIFVSKYFNGELGTDKRETSVEDVIDRIAQTIMHAGQENKYFESDKDAINFANDLTYILYNQMGIFNSPVLFNCGVTERFTGSACFINSVDDNMESITDLFKLEGRIFKGGGGSGVNLSNIRGKNEGLSRGGYSSGPVSFMKAYDAFAGVVKSGGIKRRAAVLRCLDIDHPDILDFIHCKEKEEKKVQALVDAGYSLEEAYESVAFQNCNTSVSLSDEFMRNVLSNNEHDLINRVNGEVSENVNAKDLLMEIARTSHSCGDPGVIFEGNVNKYNPYNEDIKSSNPCGEFLAINDTACNLASINLVKLLEKNNWDVNEGFYTDFIHIIHILITAQDILVDLVDYPSQDIRGNSIRYRPLGLGYANLGGMLMCLGIPYNSINARVLAGQLTKLMTLTAFYQSVAIAKEVEPCSGDYFGSSILKLSTHFSRVLGQYQKSVQEKFGEDGVVWKELIDLIKEYGIRNYQVTLLAPNGTTGMVMDCDSKGVEPVYSLINTKTLSGGGIVKSTSTSVNQGLKALGYNKEQRSQIIKYIEDNNGSVVGAPHLHRGHYRVFKCAMSPDEDQCLSIGGHINMVAAVGRFLSGGISKTVNLSNSATVEDIYNLYITCWELGIKDITIYRDGSKKIQPMNIKKKKEVDIHEVFDNLDIEHEENKTEIVETLSPIRVRLPMERQSITHKFDIAGNKGYITVGLYDNGSPGEIFIHMSKAGSIVSGLVDSFAISISMGLQYGVPLRSLIDKFSHIRFEPAGFTNNPEVPLAKSIVDYIFRWMELKFLSEKEQEDDEEDDDDYVLQVEWVPKEEEVRIEKDVIIERENSSYNIEVCLKCGSAMTQIGTCFYCESCGEGSGCS